MYGSYPNAAKGLKLLFVAQILVLIGVPLTLVLIGPLFMIVGFVLEPVALFRASSDDPGYRTALYASVANLVLGVIVSWLLDSGSFLYSAANLLSTLLSLLIVYLVCTTSCRLLAGLDSAVAARGGTVVKIYVLCTAVNLVCSVLALIPLVNVVASLLSLVANIAQIVGYVMYLTFLYSGSRALA